MSLSPAAAAAAADLRSISNSSTSACDSLRNLAWLKTSVSRRSVSDSTSSCNAVLAQRSLSISACACCICCSKLVICSGSVRLAAGLIDASSACVARSTRACCNFSSKLGICLSSASVRLAAALCMGATGAGESPSVAVTAASDGLCTDAADATAAAGADMSCCSP